MAGTPQGSAKGAETNKLRDPDHYKKIGRAGGIAKVPKGYSMADPETRIENGRAGGKKARKKLQPKI